MKLSKKLLIISSGTQISEYGMPNVGKVICRHCIPVPEGKSLKCTAQNQTSEKCRNNHQFHCITCISSHIKKIKYFH